MSLVPSLTGEHGPRCEDDFDLFGAHSLTSPLLKARRPAVAFRLIHSLTPNDNDDPAHD